LWGGNSRRPRPESRLLLGKKKLVDGKSSRSTEALKVADRNDDTIKGEKILVGALKENYALRPGITIDLGDHWMGISLNTKKQERDPHKTTSGENVREGKKRGRRSKSTAL